MKRMYAIDANRMFLLSIAVSQGMIILISGAGVRDKMVLQFLIEVFMALPGAYYLMLRKQPFRDQVGLYNLKLAQWLLLIPFAVCVESIGEFVNVLSQLFTPNVVGNHMLELSLKYPFPVAFFVIAVTPAVCEEFIFRGLLYRGYQKCSVGGAVVLSAFLFGMMHMNLNQFSYAFVIGLLFALVNEVTGSILPSVLLHLYINGKSTVILYATANELQSSEEQYSVAQLLPELLPGAIIAIIGIVVVFFILVKCRDTKKVSFSVDTPESKEQKSRGFASWKELFSPSLGWGLLICVYFMIW